MLFILYLLTQSFSRCLISCTWSLSVAWAINRTCHLWACLQTNCRLRSEWRLCHRTYRSSNDLHTCYRRHLSQFSCHLWNGLRIYFRLQSERHLNHQSCQIRISLHTCCHLKSIACLCHHFSCGLSNSLLAFRRLHSNRSMCNRQHTSCRQHLDKCLGHTISHPSTSLQTWHRLQNKMCLNHFFCRLSTSPHTLRHPHSIRRLNHLFSRFPTSHHTLRPHPHSNRHLYHAFCCLSISPHICCRLYSKVCLSHAIIRL